MISYKIHLLRCGSAAQSSGQMYVGQLDLPLSADGQAEIEQLRGSGGYPQVDRLYMSPLLRCEQTAKLLYPGCGVQVVDGLADASLGEFEGKSLDELKDKPEFVAWLQNSQESPPPGGERVEDFTARISSAFDGIVREMMRERVQSAAVIVGGGVLMTLMATLALPRLQMHEWTVAPGHGYTLLTSAQLWMQGGCAEAFAMLPAQEE